MELEYLLDAIRREGEALATEMPFGAYLEEVHRNPRLARLSHQLIYDSILAAGVDTSGGRPSYVLFRDELWGLDRAIEQVVEYFRSAASRLDVRKRILLLVGPPGSGKSTLVTLLKRGLERYTRNPEGAVYAIDDCPVHEDPLHLIPWNHRPVLGGLRVEGDLCPYCRWQVREIYGGDVSRVPVRRVVFSATEGVGIGTFVATDPRSEDLARLVGRVDVSLLEGPSRTAARRAFRLDGELNAANRGLADLIEVLKMDPRFLSVLLTLAEEQVIKLSGPGTLYADEAIVAHSNLAEYQALVADPKAAALLDRLVVVRVGYVLSVHDEVRIYRKMLRESGTDGRHLSPLALPVAATFAVLTRLSPPQRSGWSLRRKLHLYDGRYVPDAGPEDLSSLREASPEEGSFGVSPRFVLNQIAQALADRDECLSGMDLLMRLWEGLSQRAGFEERQREAWSDLFRAVRAEYDEMVQRALRRALIPRFEEAAEALARDALIELEQWSAGGDESHLPALRSLERALRIPGFQRRGFRERVMEALRAAAARGERSLHRSDPGLEEAVERTLLRPWPAVTDLLLGRGDGPETVQQRRADIIERMVDEGGFCPECAEDALEYGIQLAGPGRERRRLPRALRWLAG